MHKVLFKLGWLRKKFQYCEPEHRLPSPDLGGSPSYGGPAVPAAADIVAVNGVVKLKFMLTVAWPTRRKSPDKYFFSMSGRKCPQNDLLSSCAGS